MDKRTGKMVRNPFRVTPAESEIPAETTMMYEVEFAPFEIDSYFFQIGQAYITMLNGNTDNVKKLAIESQTMASKMSATNTLAGSMKLNRYQD
jgi:hypothetical protein